MTRTTALLRAVRSADVRVSIDPRAARRRTVLYAGVSRANQQKTTVAGSEGSVAIGPSRSSTIALGNHRRALVEA
jgi:hypothetical protein